MKEKTINNATAKKKESIIDEVRYNYSVFAFDATQRKKAKSLGIWANKTFLKISSKCPVKI